MEQIKKIHVLVTQVFYSLLELSVLALALNGDKHLLVSSCPSLYARPAVCNVNLESGEVVWTTELSEPRGVVCYREKFVLVANYGYYGHEMDVLELENGELFITDKTPEH